MTTTQLPIEEIQDLEELFGRLEGETPTPDLRPTATLSITTTTLFENLTVHIDSSLLRTGQYSISVGRISPTFATLAAIIHILRWIPDPTKIFLDVEDLMSGDIVRTFHSPPGLEPVVETLGYEMDVGDFSIIVAANKRGLS